MRILLLLVLMCIDVSAHKYPNKIDKGTSEMFNQNIIDIVKSNTFFRKEIITGKNSQVVVMSIPAGGDIGQETHPSIDQTFYFVEGKGTAVVNGQASPIEPGHLIFVPAGTQHNFINTGAQALKLFTIYAPPQHKPGTIHKTKPQE